MASHPLRVIALFTALPGKEKELKSLLTKLIPPTQKEKGCLLYELHENTINPLDLAFIEEWENEQLLEEHLVSDHVKKLAPQLQGLVVGPPDIRRYKRIDSERKEN